MTNKPLKLLAKDGEDIQVIAAVLQDSIVPACDMAYRAGEKSFVMVVHRFCWDGVMNDLGLIIPLPANEDGSPCYERISCALDITGVEGVKFHGLNPNDPAAMFELLTITMEEDRLDIIFAGNGKLRLKLANWAARLQDFGESWPTTHCPRHAT